MRGLNLVRFSVVQAVFPWRASVEKARFYECRQSPPVAGATGVDDQLGGLVHEVMVEQATGRLLAFDFAWRRRTIGIVVSQWDAVSDALVRAVPVVVAFDLFKDVFQMRLADQN